MSPLLSLALGLGLALLIATLALTFWRLWRGPSLADRVVALDLMTVATVAFCGLAAIRYDRHEFLDVALVLAVVGFLATVALARFAERREVMVPEAVREAVPEAVTLKTAIPETAAKEAQP